MSCIATQIVDHPNRVLAADAISRLRRREVEFFDFSKGFPESSDAALPAAYLNIWSTGAELYNPRSVHRPRFEARLRRWELFLATTLPYSWPARRPVSRSPGQVMLTGTSLGIILLVALLGLAASGVPIVGRFPEILAFPAGIAALAALHHFAYRRALRAESSAEGAWLSAGDPTVYPFRGIDDLLAAGGDHSLVEPRGSCPRCGYDLSTLSFPGCPECGLGRSQG